VPIATNIFGDVYFIVIEAKTDTPLPGITFMKWRLMDLLNCQGDVVSEIHDRTAAIG
jgi:hypothetical protein